MFVCPSGVLIFVPAVKQIPRGPVSTRSSAPRNPPRPAPTPSSSALAPLGLCYSGLGRLFNDVCPLLLGLDSHTCRANEHGCPRTWSLEPKVVRRRSRIAGRASRAVPVPFIRLGRSLWPVERAWLSPYLRSRAVPVT